MFPEIGPMFFDKHPFAHFVGDGKVHPVSNLWLDWMELDAPWNLTNAEFYEQHELDLLHVPLPAVLRKFVCPETLISLSALMFNQFHQSLSSNVDVTAHKLVAGQTIRLHNDFIPGGESHRLIVQINRGWEPSRGGYLMLFSGPNPETVSKVLEPTNGSVLGFAISSQSYHAVSTVHGGERYSIVYSFYPESS